LALIQQPVRATTQAKRHQAGMSETGHFDDKLDVRCHGSYLRSSGHALAGVKWHD
jgi:hypothetical protein